MIQESTGFVKRFRAFCANCALYGVSPRFAAFALLIGRKAFDPVKHLPDQLIKLLPRRRIA